MNQILVTGATGNVGLEVVHCLYKEYPQGALHVAVRNVTKAKNTFHHLPNLLFRKFDFEAFDSYSEAFHQIDVLFLLRPPHLSNIEMVFLPLLTAAKESGIKKVVFLSVQGADTSKVIPHNKIERLIEELRFDYIFVRPGYFMQNLTTTLLPEIQHHQRLTLPSGKAKFNWIDVKNIGEATAKLVINFEQYRNKAFDITGSENKDFEAVVGLISEITGTQIRFNNVNPVSFYFRKRKEGMNKGLVLVMLLLHFLPRFQKEPKISDNYQKLTGKKPTILKEFIEKERQKFSQTQ